MQNIPLTDWKILPVTRDDIGAIFKIEDASFPSPWSKNIFEREINNPVSYSLAGWLRRGSCDLLSAYIFFWIVCGEGHLLNLAVHEDFRHMGLAKRLMTFSLNFMYEKGVENVFLEVRKSNKAGIRLYESLGFRQFYVRKKYYTDEDALVMGLDLKRA